MHQNDNSVRSVAFENLVRCFLELHDLFGSEPSPVVNKTHAIRRHAFWARAEGGLGDAAMVDEDRICEMAINEALKNVFLDLGYY